MQPLRLTVVASALVLFTSITQQVDAHSHINFPQPAFQQGFKRVNDYLGDMDIKIFAAELHSRFRHEEGVQNIEKSMKFENATSLRQFAFDHARLLPQNGTVNGTNVVFTPTRECGFTLPTGRRVPMPDKVVFPWAHPGPCEIWCDNTLLASGRDCEKNPTGADYKVDKTKCVGASFLQATFVAVHSHHWQIFTNCVPLEGGTETDPVKVFNYRRGDSEVGKDSDAGGKTTTAPSTTPPVLVKPTTTPPASAVNPTATPTAPAPSFTRPSKPSKCGVSND